MTDAPALLTIAHGTRDPRGAQEYDEVLALLRERHAGPVAGAWLEDFAQPDAATAAAALVAEGARRIVTVPFLNLGAGHAKTDVPEAITQVRAAHPDVAVAHARVLGLTPGLFALARQRVQAVSPVPRRGEGRRGDEVLLLTAPGSSDPDANGDLWKATRFLAEGTGHRWVDAAFAGVTWPTADVVLRRLAAAGAKRVVRFSWSLLAGLLEQRVAGWAAEVSADTGLEVVDAGRFGPDPAVADAVMERYREAVEGDVRMNCDLCAYRVPLPGLERRVAAPSGGGTGALVSPGRA